MLALIIALAVLAHLDFAIFCYALCIATPKQVSSMRFFPKFISICSFVYIIWFWLYIFGVGA